MVARIYRPAKTAMQSGRANTRQWVLEFEAGRGRFIDPLMGWTGSADTRTQLRLRFPDEDAAIAYAKKHGLEYVVLKPHPHRPRLQSYAENFR